MPSSSFLNTQQHCGAVAAALPPLCDDKWLPLVAAFALHHFLFASPCYASWRGQHYCLLRNAVQQSGISLFLESKSGRPYVFDCLPCPPVLSGTYCQMSVLGLLPPASDLSHPHSLQMFNV